jgi:hypothetical protein
MREYNIINRCLSILKTSRIDVITKLRIERLLSALMMLLLVGGQHNNPPDLEPLLSHVTQFCTGDSSDGAKALADHVRRVHASIIEA